MQTRYITLLVGQGSQQALGVTREALRLLDQQMPSYPHDHYLQMSRGYFLKNQAMALRDLRDQKGFENRLLEADRAFRTIQAEAEVYLSNAYNGVGSVELLHGHCEQALRWTDKALELVPDHPYALHDREEALRCLKGDPVGA